jgi:hypothetical protein
VGAWTSDSDFDGRKADGHLGNLFAFGQLVFYVQPDGILDVVDSFFVGFALTVATLERRAGNEKAIGVCFNDDRKGNVLHDFGQYTSVLGHEKTECVEECENVAPTRGRKSNAPGLDTESMPVRGTESTKSAMSDFIPAGFPDLQS